MGWKSHQVWEETLPWVSWGLQRARHSTSPTRASPLLGWAGLSTARKMGKAEGKPRGIF